MLGVFLRHFYKFDLDLHFQGYLLHEFEVFGENLMKIG